MAIAPLTYKVGAMEMTKRGEYVFFHVVQNTTADLTTIDRWTADPLGLDGKVQELGAVDVTVERRVEAAEV
ncbi:MAG: hypothetical protein R3F20_05480 [Planctomycetota bacterium]